MAALIHVILETINLHLESKTSHTGFQDYMVACYSARLGWLPQEKDFYRVYKNKKPTDNDEKSSKGQINIFNVAKFKLVDIF